MKIKNIETERCVLKEIDDDDSSQIVEWRSNPEIYRFFKNPIKIGLEQHIKWYNELYILDKDRVDFIVWQKSNNIRIGVFGINKIGVHSVEISYLLDEKYQGKGYGREILDELESFFYKEWNICKFIAKIHKDNTKSISFIKKMGYRIIDREGNFIIFGKRR